MSWIQKNSFPMALSGITLLGVGGLFYYGTQGNSRYETAKSNFEQAVAEAASIEKSVPYPTAENRDAKKKAIEDFKKDVESLQKSFSALRPEALQIISPEQFIDRLVKVNNETREAFKVNAVAFPEAYFVGFKDYTGKLPAKSSTGVLGYQLEGIRELVLVLAQSGATEIKNLHRPVLDEESGLIYTPAADAVARPLPLEITFKGPERAVRRLVSVLAKTDKYFWVVRSVRIGNSQKDPPKTADAKFNVAAPRKQDNADLIFNFAPEGADAAPEAGAGQPPAGAPAPAPGAAPIAPAPAPVEAGKDRILALILGNEELLVHLRLDLMLFLEPKPLP